MRKDLYVARVFLGTSDDAEDGFKTFEICGTLSNESDRKFIDVVYYIGQRPPIKKIYLEYGNFFSNETLEIVKFLGDERVKAF